MGALIKSIEYYLPEKIITNKDLAKEFPDYDFEKFEKKVGIFSRHISIQSESALDLAINACNKLFQKEEKSEIDYILYCTQSPEYILPTTACILQNKLGLNTNIGALDINLGCSGYTYCLSLAKGLINSNQAKKILLVTAETYSKYINPKDRSNRSIFGDGATATLIVQDVDENIGEFIFGTDGSGFDKLIIKNNNKPVFQNINPFNENDKFLYMDGPEVFNFTISITQKSTNEILEKNKIKITELDQIIFHQANSFMLNYLRKNIGVEKDKFYNDLKIEGNTVSNTIPIALKKYSESSDSKIKAILIFGFGVGLSWCGGLINLKNKL